MPKKKTRPEEPKVIEQKVDCATDRLYGTIDDAIAYLIEVRDQHAGIDIRLAEDWWGYEDMSLTFTYQRIETPEEVAARLAEEARQQQIIVDQLRRQAERERDLKEFERLRVRLGR